MDEETDKGNEIAQENGEDKTIQSNGKNPFSPSLGIPAKFSVEEFLKSIKILSDKGGKAQVKELNPLFGTTARMREFHGRALKFADKLGYVKISGRSYILTEDGKKFINLSFEDKKKDLKKKLLEYEGYKDAFISLKNATDKSKKKDEITNIWINVGGQKAIRKLMTKTFASLCNWAGILEDTGKTCKLIDSLESQEESFSNGEDKTPSVRFETSSPVVMPQESVISNSCPRCQSKNIGLIEDNVLKVIENGEQTILIKQLKYYCRNCQQPFSRASKETI